jgi:hypothetical protein
MGALPPRFYVIVDADGIVTVSGHICDFLKSGGIETKAGG